MQSINHQSQWLMCFYISMITNKYKLYFKVVLRTERGNIKEAILIDKSSHCVKLKHVPLAVFYYIRYMDRLLVTSREPHMQY